MSHVTVNQQDSVLVLTLNRADKKNALTRQMYQQLADALIEANEDESIKVVRIQGAGDCFTAGNDISDFAGQDDDHQISEVSAFMHALVDCTKPVVAQVHGMAVGIGTTLLLHCDLVYAARNTRFVLPFINLGLVPEYASSYLLPRLAGRRKASEWLMLGEPFSAEDACEGGIVTTVLEADNLAARVDEVCQALAAKPQFALHHTKALLNHDKEAVEQHISVELDLFLEAMASEAAREAFDAFLHKRPLNPEKFK